MKLFKYRIFNVTNQNYQLLWAYSLEEITRILEQYQNSLPNDKLEVHAYLVGTVALTIEND